MNPEEKLSQFTGLIKWASYRYARGVPEHEFSFEDFIGVGQLTLAKCMDKWAKKKLLPKTEGGVLTPKNEKWARKVLDSKAKEDKEFAKFFKSALFHSFDSICSYRYLFAKKRIHTSVSLDDADFTLPLSDFERVNFSGFEETMYNELVDHVHNSLTSEVEKKIFMLLADPPEGLCKLAIYKNRRKQKSGHISQKTRSGVNVVRPTTGLMLEYLNDNGYRISKGVYYLHLRNIKEAVKEAIKK